MTCEHNWSRAGQRWTTYDTSFWICVAGFIYADFGQCHRSSPDHYRDCMACPATCATAFPTTPAARRWADCNDVATLRRRGEAYEHAWAKATARELDLMIEIERLKREVAASKCGICCGAGTVPDEWRNVHSGPLCPCQALENA